MELCRPGFVRHHPHNLPVRAGARGAGAGKVCASAGECSIQFAQFDFYYVSVRAIVSTGAIVSTDA